MRSLGFALRRRLIGAFLFVAAIAASLIPTKPSTAGEPPTYRTLAPIDARTKRGETRYKAQVQQMPAQPYAWGWFGAKPRSGPSWQRGYYGDLRLWSRGH